MKQAKLIERISVVRMNWMMSGWDGPGGEMLDRDVSIVTAVLLAIGGLKWRWYGGFVFVFSQLSPCHYRFAKGATAARICRCGVYLYK